MSIDERIRDIVRDLTNADLPSSGDVRFADIAGWDSVAHLHLLLDVEQTFGIQISEEVGMSLDSIDRLRIYLEDLDTAENAG